MLGIPDATKPGVKARAPRKRNQRRRMDPVTHEIMTLQRYRKQHPHLTKAKLMKQYEKLPRPRKSDARWYRGRIYSWREYVAQYVDYYAMRDLMAHWENLEISC